MPHQDTYNLNMAENHLEDKFIKHLLYVFFEQIHLLAPPTHCNPTHTSHSQTVIQPNAALDQTTTHYLTSTSKLFQCLITFSSLGLFLFLFVHCSSFCPLVLAYLWPSCPLLWFTLRVFLSFFIGLHKNTASFPKINFFFGYFDTIIKPIKANALK